MYAYLEQNGLNLQAVFSIAELPDAVREGLKDHASFSHLLLVGHGGRELWQALQRARSSGDSAADGKDPVDAFTQKIIETWFRDHQPAASYQWLYPDNQGLIGRTVDLQTLGRLAGWHGESPLRLGVDAEWGPWYAYRALLLCRDLQGIDVQSPLVTHLSETPQSPCHTCSDKPCVRVCPVDAIGETAGDFNSQACMDYRLQDNSPCARQCLARSACPVGKQHRYDREQMQYHYGVSLQTIKRWRGNRTN